MENESNYGLLLNGNAKLYRKWFKEMCDLIGIKVIYRAPRPNKHYTTYTEIDSNYECPELIGCIFDEHPQQETLKKLGWVAELQESASIIHIAYDTPGIQKGALFIIPSGLDNAKGRLFRVAKISNAMVYPASLACQIVPEFEDTYSNSQTDYTHTSHNLLREEDDN